MNHLIIYAHPSENSFSFKLKDALEDVSSQLGWKSNVRDLYQMHFDPVLSPNDLSQLKQGVTPEGIKKEQEYLQQADVISIIYPLWWAGFPAILKGYIDKVLAYGFAYEMTSEGIKGKLQGKSVNLYTSMGNSVEEYEEKGLLEAFKKIQGQEVFEFCGMKVNTHHFFPQIPDASTDKIQFHLSEVLAEFTSTWPIEA